MCPETDRSSHLDTLSNKKSSMIEIMDAVESLEDFQHERQISIGISSAVTMDLLGVYLQRYGFLNSAKVNVVSGNYDDPVGDISTFVNTNCDYVLLHPFFDNLLPSFEAQVSVLEEELISAKEEEFRNRCKIVFGQASKIKTLFVCSFHRMLEAASCVGDDKVAIALERFNQVLREEISPHKNIKLIDSDEILASVGRKNAFDQRFYYRSKAPYTAQFMDELARKIVLSERGFGAYYYKVLILDCDNTLWGGIVGEDALDGIKLDQYDYPGNVFWRIQNEIINLQKNGILVCLCSKNNPEDVDEVLEKHPLMLLKDEHIITKKVNWDDKASNIKALAKELNLGLDSFIFLDDSDFECESVRRQLPMVKTFQVPKILSNYPAVMGEIASLCYEPETTSTDKDKTLEYKLRAKAEEVKAQFTSQEEYLASLELKVRITVDDVKHSQRVSELSQKSNQFNLTTYRYSVADIEEMMGSEGFSVYSIFVSDKFGDSGLTGVIIVKNKDELAEIDSFYMSCRVIGRGVEKAVWQKISSDASDRGAEILKATFIPTAKNQQVSEFYENLGMNIIKNGENGIKQYSIGLNEFEIPSTKWIETL